MSYVFHGWLEVAWQKRINGRSPQPPGHRWQISKRRSADHKLTPLSKSLAPMKPMPTAARSGESSKSDEFEQLKRKIHNKLVDKLDLNRVGELQGDVLRREIRLVVEHLCDTEAKTMIAPSKLERQRFCFGIARMLNSEILQM